MATRLLLAGLAMIVGAMASGFVPSGALAAKKPRESLVLVGSGEVDAASSVTIDASRARGSFKALRVVGKRGDIRITDIEVRYSDGPVHKEQRAIRLQPGERTRPIGEGRERFLETVSVSVSKASASRPKGLIEIYGIQTAAGAAATRPAKAPPPPDTSNAPNNAKPGTVTARGDVLFGAQRVGFGVDRDTIRVGGQIGKFDRIRLRVLDNDIFLNEVKVIYPEGQPDVLAVSAEIKQNTWTDWLSLKGGRFIQEIQLTYRSRPNFKGQARVEVYGEYAPNWLGPNGEGRQFNEGWVLLGARPAGFVGFDEEAIPIAGNEGGFRRLRVRVRERAITLSQVRVVYGTGEEDLIPVKARIEAGSTYGPVDLKGGARTIKEIRARYRSRIFDAANFGKGAAVVEIWAQH